MATKPVLTYPEVNQQIVADNEVELKKYVIEKWLEIAASPTTANHGFQLEALRELADQAGMRSSQLF